MATPPVLILDNGAYSIKAGFSAIDLDPRIYPNSIARSRAEKKVYVADEIENCRDHSGVMYRRPFERVSCQLLLPYVRALMSRECWSTGTQKRSFGTGCSPKMLSMYVA